MEITKETTMGEMLAYDEKIAYILMQEGMHCIGCPSSIGESLEEACMVHGLDVNAVLQTSIIMRKPRNRNNQQYNLY